MVVATSFWDGTPLLERHLASQLAGFARVLYVEPPTSLLSRFRNGEARRAQGSSGLRQVEPHVHVLSVSLPPLKDRPWAKPLSQRLFRRSLRRAVSRLGHGPVAATVVTSLDPVLGAVGERVRVYYAKDDYLSGAGLLGLPQRAVERYVTALCRSADVVVAVSPHLAATLAQRGVGSVVIPNGCDVGLFAAATPPPIQQERCVAFVGHLSDRVDVGLLEALADLDVRVVLIGPKQGTLSSGRFDRLLAHPRVEWRGRLPYADLPAALSEVTTCLLPYTDSEFNRASFPLKALEYLAAGRRVVSTDLPAIEWLATDLVEVARTPEEFTSAVLRSLHTPLGAEEIAARRRFASRHTWEQRAHIFADAVGLRHRQPLVNRS